ncbi:transmembrane protein 141 isoform X2 [Melanerpes formicivorus]|uniref:transmembrane protein 141 isoform X2 n=1 Tax=Melanerpes formicivorus TaxID=211600 RepID=UPI00358EE2D2
MVNLGLRRVEDSVAAKHPVRPPAGAAGGGHRGPLGAGGGSGAAFAVQKLLNKKLPYSLQWSVLVAGATGSLASYVVTRAETQKCSDFWLYLEMGKSPQELAVAGGISHPTEILPSPEDRGSTALPLRRNKYGDVVE